MASGLFGMFGGLADAKKAANPGIAPLFYEYSGRDQQAASRAEASAFGTQANLAYEQSLLEAAQVEREYRTFRDEQALRMASSGITLAGSPLGVLTETKILGSQLAESIRDRGEAQAGLLTQEGLQMLRRGSAAAFGGFAQSLQSKFEAANRSATIRGQAFQTGLEGLKTGLSAFGGGGSYSPSGSGAAPVSTGYANGGTPSVAFKTPIYGPIF